MDKTAMKIEDEVVVTLDYILTLADGEEVERSEGDPLVFLQGAGEIIIGLEKALYGMKVGDEKVVVVQPAEGYGEHYEEDIDSLSYDDFPEDLHLQAGMILEMYDEEADEALIGQIVELTADEIIIDFNHPLAGEVLNFAVKVLEIRSATEEELEHGHAHYDGDGHH